MLWPVFYFHLGPILLAKGSLFPTCQPLASSRAPSSRTFLSVLEQNSIWMYRIWSSFTVEGSAAASICFPAGSALASASATLWELEFSRDWDCFVASSPVHSPKVPPAVNSHNFMQLKFMIPFWRVAPHHKCLSKPGHCLSKFRHKWVHGKQFGSGSLLQIHFWLGYAVGTHNCTELICQHRSAFKALENTNASAYQRAAHQINTHMHVLAAHKVCCALL